MGFIPLEPAKVKVAVRLVSHGRPVIFEAEDDVTQGDGYLAAARLCRRLADTLDRQRPEPEIVRLERQA
jgi:hypothetical protein